MLAQTVIDLPLAGTMKWLVGLIGFITLGIAVLSFVILTKKVFGRKPSIGKELSDNQKALRSEIYQVNGHTKKELNARFYALEKRVDAHDERFEELMLSNARQWKELAHDLSEMRETLAFIRGRFATRANQE